MIKSNQAEMQEVDVVQPEMEVVTPPMPAVVEKKASQPTV